MSDTAGQKLKRPVLVLISDSFIFRGPRFYGVPDFSSVEELKNYSSTW